ncbi:MAG: Holliday junction branch migration DNA helicase RuvB, partial [Pseudomonadota bacterium]
MIETDRLITPAAESPREDAIDRAIRPKTLDEYVGQRAVREQMS